jgi:tetratricopeptide (TPR) repeat protein
VVGIHAIRPVFLQLHGHTPGQQPVDPADALASLLLAVGVPAVQVPPDLQARAALLVRLAGRNGLSGGDPGVRQITELCGYLPLAIGLVARQLRHHPGWSVAVRAAELASVQDRLGLMETENLSVAAAFDLSYATQAEERQRLFRHLGLHPGSDVDAYAAAALDDISPPAARRGLEDLYDQHLLTEIAPGRFRLHDLIREHARALAGRLDPETDRGAATARLLDYYQHTAATANTRIARQVRPAPDPAGAPPAASPGLTDMPQALAWSRAERANLLACLDYAAAVGQPVRVTALTAGISALLRYDGPWADTVVRHTAAAAAAQQLGDQISLANALSDLGNAGWLTDDYPAATQAYEQAVGLYRELGNRLGQANALSNLGAVRQLTGDYPAAARALNEALGLYRDTGYRGGEAEVLNGLGALHRVTGELALGWQCHQQSLETARDVASPIDEAQALAIFQRIGAVETAEVAAELDALGSG